jgi:hypothetical protein
MTVEQLTQQQLTANPDLRNCGTYRLDGGRLHTILQSDKSRKITIIYESKDEIDPVNNAKSYTYDSVLELLRDHPLDGSLNQRNGAQSIY